MWRSIAFEAEWPSGRVADNLHYSRYHFALPHCVHHRMGTPRSTSRLAVAIAITRAAMIRNVDNFKCVLTTNTNFSRHAYLWTKIVLPTCTFKRLYDI
eukprot:SAG31_NODE_1308_length_8879_cov_3.158884_4_plen_98_part_00